MDTEVGGSSPRDQGNPDECARTVLPRDKPLLRSDVNDPLGGNKTQQGLFIKEPFELT